MKSSDYWKKRFEELENASNSYGISIYKKIEPVFKQAQREFQKEIEAWYGRFAKNNSVSMQEARKQLSANELKEFKWDINEYIKYGRENALNQQWMKELENASVKFHISRLEALKIRTQQAAEKAFGNELDYVDKMARKIYSDTYYHSIFEMQKGFNIGFEIGQIDERKLNKIIIKPWAAAGKNFSDRIWQQKAQLVDELHTQLTRNCLLGKAPDDAIKAISKKFDVSKNQAGRLIMTEEAYFHSEAQREAFKELDVEEFEVVATLDSKTSDICKEMDGEHFPMSEYEPGKTAPPFHCWCRSVTVPYFDDDFGEIGERAARDANGKTYNVPADMKYKEWEKKYVRTDKNSILKNFMNNVKMNKSVVDCNSFKDLEKYLDNTYGIKTTKAVYNLDFDTVKETFDGIENVFVDFPDVPNLISKVVARSGKGIMSCNGDRIRFNPLYYSDSTTILDLCKKQSKIGYWISNSSPASIGVHEAAHGIEFALIKANSAYTTMDSQVVAWNDCTEARNIVNKAIQNVLQTPYGKNNGLLKSGYALRKSISEYATDSYSETMAEAFADIYANGSNANPLSIEIRKLTVEQMNKYKGVK